MRTLLRLITLSACIWSTFSCLLLVRAAGPCFQLAGKSCTFYATVFDHWPILRMLGFNKTPAVSQSTFVVGNYTPHVIRNGCKNRQIHISCLKYFPQEISMFQCKIGENLKTYCVTYLGLDLSFFVKTLWNLCHDPVPLKKKRQIDFAECAHKDRRTVRKLCVSSSFCLEA
jgi:hypothetical protein